MKKFLSFIFSCSIIFNIFPILSVFAVPLGPGGEAIVEVEAGQTLRDAFEAKYCSHHVDDLQTINEYRKCKTIKVITNEEKKLDPADFIFLNKALSNLEEVDLSESELENHQLPDYAFFNNQTIQKIVIPKSVTTLEPCCCSRMPNLKYFGTDPNKDEGLYLLESINIIKNNAFSKVKITGDVFIKGNNTIIENQAFYNATIDGKIFIEGNGISIMDYCFDYTKVNNIVILDQNIKTGPDAFSKLGYTSIDSEKATPPDKSPIIYVSNEIEDENFNVSLRNKNFALAVINLNAHLSDDSELGEAGKLVAFKLDGSDFDGWYTNDKYLKLFDYKKEFDYENENVKAGSIYYANWINDDESSLFWTKFSN